MRYFAELSEEPGWESDPATALRESQELSLYFVATEMDLRGVQNTQQLQKWAMGRTKIEGVGQWRGRSEEIFCFKLALQI